LTDLVHLLAPEQRETWKSPAASFDARAMLADLHWHFAGGRRAKPVMLQQFNARDGEELIALAGARKKTNLWQRDCAVTASGASARGLREAMHEFDEWANLHWPVVHCRAALRQLGTSSTGTGGTEWGRAWVEKSRAP
jgi:hypothetical protein